MRLITISGLDGSGKSTQIEMLKTYLESQGKKVFYFHAVEHGLAKRIVDLRNKYCLLCRLAGRRKSLHMQKSAPSEKSVTRANALQIWLRKVFLRIDIWRFKRLRNQLRNSGYDYILSDRYFYDSIVNIEYLKNRKEQKFLLPANAKPDLAGYLQISPESIMQRDRVPDQGIEYLKKKKELYDAKAREWNMKIIDGNKSKDEIWKEIQSILP